MREPVDMVMEAMEEIRPELIAEGGDVKLAGCSDGVVYVTLAGPFTASCRSRRMMLWNIERIVKGRLPWIERVEAICPPPEDQAW
jgi:Fe-S cluster biogenesis protein NfuA